MTPEDLIYLKQIKAICKKEYSTTHHGHNAAWAIRELFLAGHLKVIDIKHKDPWIRENELDLKTKAAISAYDDNIYVELMPDDTVRIVIDKSEVSLRAKPSRWHRTFILEGSWWLHKPFVDRIQETWYNYTAARVDAELVIANERRRVEIAEQILAGKYDDPMKDD